MKILSSPAKLMNIAAKTSLLPSTTPTFIDEAEKIQSHLKDKSPEGLKKLMKISDKLAQENWERNQQWSPHPKAKESTQALFAFAGQVYQGLEALSLTQEDLDYLQKHFRMISGLYGLLRPSDKIMLYRLEMGSKFSFDTYKNLYSFWREKLTDKLNKDLKKSDFILNLASNEYSKAIDFKKLKAPAIDFNFYEIRDGKAKNIMTYTKIARGLMIRHCAENKVQNLEAVKAFNTDGYLFSDELSTENHFVFTRG